MRSTSLTRELEALEQDSRDQVRRLARMRRQRNQELDRLLHGLAVAPPAAWVGANADQSNHWQQGRWLADELARAMVREDRRRRRLPDFERGTSWERLRQNYNTGSWLGALVGGQGPQARQWGGLGGMLGTLLGGRLGGFVGSLLGGLFGGHRDRDRQRQQQQQRRWLNTPEGFEIEAYLYNLYRNSRASGGGGGVRGVQVLVQRGAVQISGGDVGTGVRAADALLSQLGRAVELAQAASTAQG